MTTGTVTGEVDAVVIGAGFAGIYMNYRLRDQMGMDVQVDFPLSACWSFSSCFICGAGRCASNRDIQG